MPVRADRSLELRLEHTEELAVADEVTKAVAAVIGHMRSGKTSRLRGGQRLVTLLEAARQRAAEEHEWEVVRGLQGALDHATGQAPEAQDETDLTELRQTIEAPDATEDDLRRALETRPWIFGGKYIDGQALLPDSEFDLFLIRGDGSVHIVAVKPAMRLPALIKRNRGGWSLMPEVHEAVGQAQSYLVSLDENRDWVREKFGVDARRASATVLIGHPAVQPHIAEDQINEVLRMFNAQRTRVEVITYKELADSAERSLSL